MTFLPCECRALATPKPARAGRGQLSRCGSGAFRDVSEKGLMVAQTRQALTRPIVRYRCHPVHRCRRADRCVEEVDLGCITVSIRAAKVEIPEEDTRQPIDALASGAP